MGDLHSLPPALRKTYAVRHRRRSATCNEMDPITGQPACLPYWNGWETVVHPVDQAAIVQYFRSGDSGRRFTEETLEDGRIRFTFARGQRCFRSDQHFVFQEEDPLFLVLGGDQRGNPLGVTPLKHSGADPFIDDFASHQDGLARAAE